MDSLELKVPASELEDHLRQIRYMSTPDRQKAKRKAKENKAPASQRKVTASEGELKELASRNKKWSETQDERPGAKNVKAKYTSNKTHYSPTDPDARISVKPGKARKLNYAVQLTVDSAHHVITDMMADYADKKDNQSLQQVSFRVKERLHQHGLLWHNVLADTGYSSGDNYAYLEREGLQSFIPAHGTYKGFPDQMTYDREGDFYVCRNGKHLTHRKIKYNARGTKENHYATGRKDCLGCPYGQECKGNSHEKRIRVTYYKPEYERAIARIKSKQGSYMKKKQQSTVEPVFGTLTQFMGLRKVNTKGIKQAQKVMLLSAVAYNIKKYLKFTQKLAATRTESVRAFLASIIEVTRLDYFTYRPLKI